MGPNITYNTIYTYRFNPMTKERSTVPINLSSTGTKVSFIPPCNSIHLEFSSNVGLTRYLVRATKENEDYDVDLGARLVYQTSLAANTLHKIDIPISAENFNTNGVYRIGLYAQSELNYEWDITYLFFTINEATSTPELFKPQNAEGMEVIAHKYPFEP